MYKIDVKKIHLSYGFLVLMVIFFISQLVLNPVIRKIPYWGEVIYAWQLDVRAKRLPEGSEGRATLERLSRNIRGEEGIYKAENNNSGKGPLPIMGK